MNIAENLQLLQQTKEQIRQAINSKGVTLEQSAPFSAYTAAILAIPTGGGQSIPEGLHKFTISQSNWPDCAMMVEAFYNPDELKKGERGSQTVNIYTDPFGEPVNSITYNGYVIGGVPDVDVQNSDFNAGVYCTNSSDWTPYETGSQAFKLECRTAGDYYIEVADHTDPKFFDANGTQIYPDNHVNS